MAIYIFEDLETHDFMPLLLNPIDKLEMEIPSNNVMIETLGQGEAMLYTDPALKRMTIDGDLLLSVFRARQLLNIGATGIGTVIDWLQDNVTAIGTATSRLREGTTEALDKANEQAHNIRDKTKNLLHIEPKGTETPLNTDRINQFGTGKNLARTFTSVDEYIGQLLEWRYAKKPLLFYQINRDTDRFYGFFQFACMIDTMVYSKTATGYEERNYNYRLNLIEYKNISPRKVIRYSDNEGRKVVELKPREHFSHVYPKNQPFWQPMNMDGGAVGLMRAAQHNISRVMDIQQQIRRGRSSIIELYKTNRRTLSQDPLNEARKVLKLPDEVVGR